MARKLRPVDPSRIGYKVVNANLKSSMGDEPAWRIGEVRKLKNPFFPRTTSDLCSPRSYHWCDTPSQAHHMLNQFSVMLKVQAIGRVVKDSRKNGSTGLKVLDMVFIGDILKMTDSVSFDKEVERRFSCSYSFKDTRVSSWSELSQLRRDANLLSKRIRAFTKALREQNPFIKL